MPLTRRAESISMSDAVKALIFLTYASPDKERVLDYYAYLEEAGFSIWMDCKQLKAGQKWDHAIRTAFDKASIIVAFVSENSYQRRGYVQRELALALRKLEEKLPDDIYIIPVMLDEGVDIPCQLKDIQAILPSDVDAWQTKRCCFPDGVCASAHPRD
jgi:hypothetical protein